MAHSACVSCHQRKVRCDAHTKGFPCSNCILSQRPNCRVHQKKRRALPRGVNNPVPLTSRSSVVSTPQYVSRPLQRISPDTTFGSPDVPSFTGGEPVEAGEDLNRFMNGEELGPKAIHKGVRITYVGEDFSNISFLVGQRLEGQNENVYHFPSQQIAKRYLRHEANRIPPEGFVLPDKALADDLVNAYFAHVNPGCPIVDEEVFLAQYGGLDPADPPSLLILQAIFLVGAHVSKALPERNELKSMFFKRAKMLFDARVEWNRDSMVQAALLLTWFSDGAEDIGANAWYWVGAAARIATGLGMHRDTGSSSLSSADKCRWRRTWWILFQHDVSLSLFYGRPQAIHLEECDVPSLNILDFEDCGPGTEIDYIINYTELCMLISRVLRARFGLKVTPEQRKAALGNADEALANWCLQLPAALHLRASDTNIWTASLHLNYSNFLILLHRPNPRVSHRLEDSGPNDADICIVAANAITTIFEDLRKKDRIKTLWISGLNALFTAMIQVGVELRFSNPVLAIHAQRRFDSTISSLRELSEYWIIAGSVLQIFKDNSSTQDKKKFGGCFRNNSLSTVSQQGLDGVHTTASTSISQRESNKSGRISGRSDLDVLASAANAVVERINAGLIEQEQEEVSDWRQLFPFSDSEQEGVMIAEDILVMENEWREIYWQEPGLLGSFGGGLGSWL